MPRPRERIMQIDLLVDPDGPQALFHYWDHKRPSRRYRCPVYVDAGRKRRFIQRVSKAQEMLCQTMEECDCGKDLRDTPGPHHHTACGDYTPF